MTEIEDKPEGIILDAEAAFLVSHEETGNEWEIFKENVRPLKRGRNVEQLNKSLQFHTQNDFRTSLVETRRKLIEAIDQYQGDDPLHPWLECIKWVQEAFPAGGDSAGLLIIYEQCVRAFWHSEQYKDDLRYLKVWLEYAENCKDAEVIYKFLETNNIGKSHSVFYIAYAVHMERKSKMKLANDIFYLGISRVAQPIKKLQEAYKKFISRSMKRENSTETEEPEDSHMPSRCFGTVLGDVENRITNVESCSPPNKKGNNDRNKGTSLAIYKETNTAGRQSVTKKSDLNPWLAIGAAAERNKENSAAPSKWTEHKLPLRGISRGFETVMHTPCIDVFVDEECEKNTPRNHRENKRKHKCRPRDTLDTKKESENLRENPLRNFPPNSLPRL